MIAVSVVVLCLLLTSSSTSSATRIFHRATNQGVLWYLIDDNEYSFQDSVKHCSDLGGTLPIIHSQEDYDYLIDKLNETTGSNRTWLGLEQRDGDCKTWMDGSKLTFNFTNDTKNSGYSCCSTTEACSLKLWNDVEDTAVYGKVFMSRYMASPEGRRVCVLKNLSLKELDDKVRKTEKSLTKKMEEASLQQSKSLNETRATMLQQYQNLEEGMKKNITHSLLNLEEQNKKLTRQTQAMEKKTKVMEAELENSKSTGKVAFYVACSSLVVLGFIPIAVGIFVKRIMSKLKKLEDVPSSTLTRVCPVLKLQHH